MTDKINVFCFVYIHDNQIYRHVKTKTLHLKCKYYLKLRLINVSVACGSNFSYDKIISTLQHKII